MQVDQDGQSQGDQQNEDNSSSSKVSRLEFKDLLIEIISNRILCFINVHQYTSMGFTQNHTNFSKNKEMCVVQLHTFDIILGR